MTAKELLASRLHHQYLVASPAKTAGEAVARLCAMQAQDYAGAKWSIGLRVPGLTDAAVETAIANKTIIRISSLRGTIHLLAAEDARWVSELLKPRMVATYASFCKNIGITEAIVAKSQAIFVKALEGGNLQSRDELKAALEKKKIDTSGHRMNVFITRAGTDGLMCFAPRRGKEFVYTLLDEWLPRTPANTTGQGLHTLALRYFTGHGPATVQDFAYWCGSTLTAAKAAIAELGGELQKITAGGETYWLSAVANIPAAIPPVLLLPGFDEYYTGYTGRGLLGNEAVLKSLITPNGILQPIIVVNGKVAGCWKRTVKKDTLELSATPFSTITDAAKKAMVKHSKDFGAFMGMPVQWI